MNGNGVIVQFIKLLLAIVIVNSYQVFASQQSNIEGLWRIPYNVMYSYDFEAPTPDQIIPGLGPLLEKAFKPIIIDPEDGKIPYQPWARERREYLYQASADPKSLQEVDPNTFCVPNGPPRFMYYYPVQIEQYPDYVVMLTEPSHSYRIISLEDRAHLPEQIKLFRGDARGQWKDNILEVDVTNNNGRNWLSVVGDFHSDKLTIKERYTLTSPNTLLYQATISDPVVYTRTWTLSLELVRIGTNSPNDVLPAFYSGYDEILETACHEGNEGHFEHLMKLREQP